MVSAAAEADFKTAVQMCVNLYGVDETREIMKVVETQIESKGLGGAFVHDWLSTIRDISVTRNPYTAGIWSRMNLYRGDA